MNRGQITIIALFMLLMFSCDKSKTEEKTDIYGKWIANEFMSLESVAYPKTNGFNPVIEFKHDGSYLLNLDINSCSGSFTLPGDNKIEITAAGCTKMCCDSEFSKKFIQMLPHVKSYQLENNNLRLEIPDWGWIELVLNN